METRTLLALLLGAVVLTSPALAAEMNESPSPSPTATAAASPTPTATANASPSPSPSPTANASPSPSPTASPSPSPSPTATAAASPSPTATAAPTAAPATPTLPPATPTPATPPPATPTPAPPGKEDPKPPPIGGATAKFRQPPSVSLTSTKTSVEADSPALLTISMINPTINDVSLSVQAIMKVGSGITISGTSFAAGGSNQFTGDFVVPPGGQRHYTLTVTSDDLGKKTIESQIIYYPGENKDAYQQLQQTLSVEVKERSKPIPAATPAGQAPTPRQPGFEVALALGGIFAVALLLRRRP